MSGPSVRARQTFSCGCGISRSTTIERVGAATASVFSAVCSWLHPFQNCFKFVEPVTPEGAVEIEPVHHRPQRIGLHAIVSFASRRGDAPPALPASALSDAWRQQAGTPPHSESMRGRSVRLAGSAPRRWPCVSDRRERGTRDWHSSASHQNHSHTVMDCQAKRNCQPLIRPKPPHPAELPMAYSSTQSLYNE